jgi:hypothetical protein
MSNIQEVSFTERLARQERLDAIFDILSRECN